MLDMRIVIRMGELLSTVSGSVNIYGSTREDVAKHTETKRVNNSDSSLSTSDRWNLSAAVSIFFFEYILLYSL